MQLFYTPDIKGNEYVLDREESKHCVKVLRKVKGDILHLTDGTGNLYKAEIVNADIKACQLSILEVLRNFEKRDYHLHMAVAPTKNTDRYEWFLEKATEIGVDEITPVITKQSERDVLKPDRLERIIISAMKQSIKAYKPILNNIITYNEFLNQPRKEEMGFIAHCNDSEKGFIRDNYKKRQSCLILIGPEGDFTTVEVNQAISNGYIPISLGNSRLRTETAAVVACHTISLINQ